MLTRPPRPPKLFILGRQAFDRRCTALRDANGRQVPVDTDKAWPEFVAEVHDHLRRRVKPPFTLAEGDGTENGSESVDAATEAAFLRSVEAAWSNWRNWVE